MNLVIELVLILSYDKDWIVHLLTFGIFYLAKYLSVQIQDVDVCMNTLKFEGTLLPNRINYGVEFIVANSQTGHVGDNFFGLQLMFC